MNDADIEALIIKLRSTTQLVRLSHDEAKAVVLTILLAAPKESGS